MANDIYGMSGWSGSGSQPSWAGDGDYDEMPPVVRQQQFQPSTPPRPQPQVASQPQTKPTILSWPVYWALRTDVTAEEAYQDYVTKVAPEQMGAAGVSPDQIKEFVADFIKRVPVPKDKNERGVLGNLAHSFESGGRSSGNMLKLATALENDDISPFTGEPLSTLMRDQQEAQRTASPAQQRFRRDLREKGSTADYYRSILESKEIEGALYSLAETITGFGPFVLAGGAGGKVGGMITKNPLGAAVGASIGVGETLEKFKRASKFVEKAQKLAEADGVDLTDGEATQKWVRDKGGLKKIMGEAEAAGESAALTAMLTILIVTPMGRAAQVAAQASNTGRALIHGGAAAGSVAGGFAAAEGIGDIAAGDEPNTRVMWDTALGILIPSLFGLGMLGIKRGVPPPPPPPPPDRERRARPTNRTGYERDWPRTLDAEREALAGPVDPLQLTGAVPRLTEPPRRLPWKPEPVTQEQIDAIKSFDDLPVEDVATGLSLVQTIGKEAFNEHVKTISEELKTELETRRQTRAASTAQTDSTTTVPGFSEDAGVQQGISSKAEGRPVDRGDTVVGKEGVLPAVGRQPERGESARSVGEDSQGPAGEQVIPRVDAGSEKLSVTRSFRELATKSEELQKQIDAKHEALDRNGLTWEQQIADPALTALYNQRIEYDTVAALKGYEGGKRIIEQELGAVADSMYVSVDSILRERYSLSPNPAGVFMMSEYTGKELDSPKTLRDVASDITKLLFAKEYPNADFFAAMESNMSGISSAEKSRLSKVGAEKAKVINEKLKQFFVDEVPASSKKIIPLVDATGQESVVEPYVLRDRIFERDVQRRMAKEDLEELRILDGELQKAIAERRITEAQVRDIEKRAGNDVDLLFEYADELLEAHPTPPKAKVLPLNALKKETTEDAALQRTGELEVQRRWEALDVDLKTYLEQEKITPEQVRDVTTRNAGNKERLWIELTDLLKAADRPPTKPIPKKRNTLKKEAVPFRFTGSAFRDQFSGEVYPTGAIHDRTKLPVAAQNLNAGVLEAGFIGSDGKFYTRKEAEKRIRNTDAKQLVAPVTGGELHSSNLDVGTTAKAKKQRVATQKRNALKKKPEPLTLPPEEDFAPDGLTQFELNDLTGRREGEGDYLPTWSIDNSTPGGVRLRSEFPVAIEHVVREGKVSGGQMMQWFAEHSDVYEYRVMAQAMLPHLRGKGVRIEVVPKLTNLAGESKRGRADSDTNIVTLDRKYGVDQETLFHELTHIATVNGYENPRTAVQRAAVKEIDKLFQEAKAKRPTGSDNVKGGIFDQAYLNEKEFMANAHANPTFRDHLRGMANNWWKRFVNAVKRLIFGDNAKIDENMLDRVMRASGDLYDVRKAETTEQKSEPNFAENDTPPERPVPPTTAVTTNPLKNLIATTTQPGQKPVITIADPNWFAVALGDKNAAVNYLGATTANWFARRNLTIPESRQLDTQFMLKNSDLRFLSETMMRQEGEGVIRRARALMDTSPILRAKGGERVLDDIMRHVNVQVRRPLLSRYSPEARLTPEYANAQRLQDEADTFLTGIHRRDRELGPRVIRFMREVLKPFSNKTIWHLQHVGRFGYDTARRITDTYEMYLPMAEEGKVRTGSSATGQSRGGDNFVQQILEQRLDAYRDGIDWKFSQLVHDWGQLVDYRNEDGSSIFVFEPIQETRRDRTTGVIDIVDVRNAKNSVVFWENGVPMRMELNAQNENLLSALNKFKGPQRHIAIQKAAGALSYYTRVFSILHTSLSPMFAPKNFVRDYKTVLTGLDQRISYTQFHKSLTSPEVIAAALYHGFRESASLTGKDTLQRNLPGVQLARLVDRDSGLIDKKHFLGVEQMVNEPATSLRPSVDSKMAEYFSLSDGKVTNILTGVTKFMESWIRVAVQHAAMKSDIPTREAAVLAKRTTGNFEQRGDLTQRVLAPAFPFSASKMTGARLWLENIGATQIKGPGTGGLKKAAGGLIGGPVPEGANPRTVRATQLFTVLGLVTAYLGYKWGEKDDDGRSKHGKKSEHQLDQYFPIPFTNISTPMPQDTGMGYVLGSSMGDALWGDRPGGKTGAALRFATAVINNFAPGGSAMHSPIGDRGNTSDYIMRLILPIPAVPVYDVAANKTTWGDKINFDWDSKTIPPEMQGAASASKFANTLAKDANKLASVDVSPKAIDHVIMHMFGQQRGAFNAILDGNMGALLSQPFKSFGQEPYKGVDRQDFDDAYRDVMNEGARDKGSPLKGKEGGPLVRSFKDADNKLRKLNERNQKAKTQAEKDVIEEKEKTVRRNPLKRYNQERGLTAP